MFSIDNPLECGCDVAWLYADGVDYWDRFWHIPTCKNGKYLDQLDPSQFDDC